MNRRTYVRLYRPRFSARASSTSSRGAREAVGARLSRDIAADIVAIQVFYVNEIACRIVRALPH